MYQNITNYTGIFKNDTLYFKRNVDSLLQVAVFSAIGVVSFVTNFIIIFVIYTHRIIRSRSNSLLINLAISDILVVVVGVPIQSVNLLSKNGPITVGAICQLHGALVLLTFLVSNFNLVLIAAYRYLLIVKPKLHDFLFSKVNLFFIIVMTYLTVGIIVLPALLNWGSIDYNPFRAHCMVVWGYSLSYLLFLQFFAFNIPLVIIAFCYYKIITCTINSRKRLNKTVDNKIKFQEQRLTCMLLVVMGCFFTCFMPYAILLYYEGAFKKKASEMFSFFAMVFAYFNSTLDFFIYSIMNAKFRRALKNRITSIRPKPSSESESSQVKPK